MNPGGRLPAALGRSGLITLLALMLCSACPVAADPSLWKELRAGGHVLLIRHAETEPGIGDPPEFRLGDCSTQRNLSPAGRLQSQRIGKRFAALGIPIDGVLSSRWCRCLDTANLAFGKATPEPALDSFFADRQRSDAQTAAMRSRIQSFRGPGNLVMVTHQVNITAITGKFPAPGEIFVLRGGAQDQPQWIGRITPAD